MRIIGYERVSTARQGASGLGIAAQRLAIDGFVAQRQSTLIARFTEVESGRNPDRPELQRALQRSGGATSLRAIAAELNDRGMLTRRGGRWHVSTVMNLLERLGFREAACAMRKACGPEDRPLWCRAVLPAEPLT
jgi:Resolvase, N terminal domain/Recombinase